MSLTSLQEQGQSPGREEGLWTQLTAPENPSAFFASWLALCCQQIRESTGGLLLLGKADCGPYSPVAIWPDASRDVQDLVPAAEKALTKRQGLVLKNEDTGHAGSSSQYIAYPVEVYGKIHGVLVLALHHCDDARLQAIKRQTLWSAAWLENQILRNSNAEALSIVERLAALLELTAHTVKYEKFTQAAMTLVNDLATRLSCDRISLGLVHGRAVRLLAVSHSSSFHKRSNLVRETEELMEEAIDQQSTIILPADQPASLACLHQNFLRRHELAALCTVPLRGRTGYFGALLLERSSQAFDPALLEMLKSLGSLLGPVLENQWRQEHWVRSGLLQAPRRWFHYLFGPDGFILKSVVAGLVLAVIIFSLVETEFRVSSKTVIEGAVQRSIVAPFDGFIAGSRVRPGDLVAEGQELCVLDDRDLLLEQQKWRMVAEQYRKKYRQAIGTHERAEAQVVAAQIRQAEAEEGLLEEKLLRSRITAPFSGVIISGDLHQKLRSPVQTGEELFQLAPLEMYRVILQVDEHDMAYVQTGQKGVLLLSSLPRERFHFSVQKITPVSVSEEGKNYFRVEAQLDQAPSILRPGMEGIGKIESGRRSLLWIWTRTIRDWIRLKIWAWTP